MILPENIRSVIAGRIIRIIAPVIIGVSSLAIIAILVFAGHQQHRILTALTGIVFASLAWWLTLRGRPLTGIRYIISGFVIVTLIGVFFGGGLKSPIYPANLAFIIIVVVLYGLKGGILYTLAISCVGAAAFFLDSYGLLPVAANPPPQFLLVHYAYMMPLVICFVLVPVRLMLDTLSESQEQSSKFKVAVAEKQQAQEKLQSILDKTPDIIYRLDTKGNITYISNAIEHYGYRPEELIGSSIANLVPQEDRKQVKRRLTERRTGNRGTRGFEIRIMKGPYSTPTKEYETYQKSATTFHVYSDGLYSESRTSGRSFIGTQGIAHDVSKLKNVENRMAFLASVVDQAAEDVIITDPDGLITYVNPKFEEVSGYSSEEVLGKTPSILRSTRHGHHFFENIWKTITAGEIWKGHIWNKTKSGREILQDMTIKPIVDSIGQITGYVSVRRDITKKNELEDQIRQSQKMEAIGTLAGGIAHDFNNILSGILGYAELARYDVEDSPKTLQKVDNIISAGKRATDLVAQILSFSRSQKSTPKPASPKIITREVLKLLRASLPSNIEIVQRLNSDSNVFADPVNIHQILMNLCTNAGHAMRAEGGRLTVSLEDVCLDESEAGVHIDLMPGKYIKISIIDTGKGIPDELRKRIFNPFFTTKTTGEGTGMGLSVVHGIVKDLEGEILLRSKEGEGSTFEVYLPIIDEKEELSVAGAERNLPRGTERILFIDDEEMQADLAERSLGRFGYSVTVFTNSLEAFNHFRDYPRDYDLVITDMTMPMMTGDVLTLKIHEINPELPVIMCTGFSEIMDANKAEALDIKALLYKPVIKNTLLKTVRMVLDGKVNKEVSHTHEA